jgi:hypothetical protein
MNKFILIALLMVSVSTARAENSATAYDASFRSQQVFVTAYNNSASTLSRDNVVILDTSGTAGSTLGAYVTTNGSTTDSVYVFGVTDESILSGSLGRICVRGPHKVVMPAIPAAATVIGACSNSPSGNAGKACPTTTADGTISGQLGVLLSTTATSDTGDASNTYWAWVRINSHK